MYYHLLYKLVWLVTALISLHFGLGIFGHNLLGMLGLHNPNIQTTIGTIAIVAGALSLLFFVAHFLGYSHHH